MMDDVPPCIVLIVDDNRKAGEAVILHSSGQFPIDLAVGDAT
jgi:hypothetical protein